MKELTNITIAPRLHKPNVAQQAKKALPKEKPIPEGYVTLDEFMMNLLNAIDHHYAEKKDSC